MELAAQTGSRSALRTAPRPADTPPELPLGRDLGRVVSFDQAAARFGRARVEQVTDGYCIGDEVAYAVLADIHGPTDFTWQDCHRAVEHGLERLGAPPDSLVALVEEAHRIPDWVDWDQLYRGAVAYWRNGPIVALALTSAIGGGFASYGGMKPTIFSGRLIDERRVGRRIVETLRYIAKVTTPGSMQPGAEGWRYTLRLRLLHGSVRWGCSRAEGWDWDDWGLAINVNDNSQAPLEFSVGLMDMLAAVGLRFTAREERDVFALWRYVSYLLGTPEAYLGEDPDDGRERLEIVYATNHPADDTNRLMLHTLVDFAAHHGIGYDPLPSWTARLLPPPRRKALTYGLIYAWSRQDVRDQMDIPCTPWRHLLAPMRAYFSVAERAQNRFGPNDEWRCRRMLDAFAPVTTVRRGDAPLADPHEVGEDIRTGGARIAALLAARARGGAA